MKTTKRALALVSGIAIAALALTGCSSGGSSDDTGSSKAISQSEIDKAMNTPTTVTFWTWVPDISNEVKLFEEKYPKITVKVENVGQGLTHYQKLRTALKSGDGAPDVAQMEYQYLPSFEVTNNIADLAPYGAAKTESNYPEWIWKQISRDGKVYAVPQDSGPMGNLYRKDLLEKAGITEAPKTYDEYAADAAKIKQATGAAIQNLAANDPAQMVGLLWQAGAKPFGYDGDKGVSIDVDSAKAKKVYSYWQDMIDKGYVTTDPDFTDNWYQGFTSDKYAGWLTAAWAPVFLQGTIAKTSGKWEAAPLPQWSDGENVSGNWGGSTDVVLNTSKNKIAAYELAKFINSDKESALMLNSKQSLFPTTKTVLNDSSFTDSKSEFFGGQQVNKAFSAISDTVDTDFEWLPFTDYAYTAYNNTVGKALANKGDITAAAEQWQQQLESYAKQQGFTVK
ncbi:ABC transporter substrate-binding protein [Curtobacterium citreum]|uniref:ABC transporter substrate-binding protein n=1 Tax=Curtobacterium citreum TaxID=2036 RepID=UPI002ED2B1A2